MADIREDERFQRWWRLVEAGICHVCGAPMTPVQVGRDVHAHPCGH